jgi:hypothetical protein
LTVLETTHTPANSSITTEGPDKFALIIGGMKCGTTSLFDILSQHPQICPSRVKEPDFFIKDRNDDERKKYLELWNWDENTHIVAMESSVAYTKAPFIKGVPKRISSYGLGEYKFIYMLRNPLKRIESQVRHGLFAGWGKSLDEGVSDDLIAFSRYAMQIDNYLEYFPRENVLLVTLEGFKNNPQAVLADICKFLEINISFHFTNVEKPRNTGDFFNTPPIISRLTQSRFITEVARSILPVKFRKSLRNWVAKMSKSTGEENQSHIGRWRLNPEEKTKILEQLADDLKRLDSDYGIDVKKLWDVPPELLG